MRQITRFITALAVYTLAVAAPARDQSAPDHAQDQTATTIKAGPISRVSVARGFRPAITTSRAFVDVPEAMVVIRVTKKSLLTARFASDSFCRSQYRIGTELQSGYCSVRILVLVNGSFVEMAPFPTGHFQVFQVHDGSGSHAIERSYVVRPGAYTVKVQFSNPFGIEPGATFDLRFWHLTVEAARIVGARKRH